jgi:histone-binding protein RBBP4
MFGSSADDGYLNVWDVNKIGAAQSAEKKKTAAPEIVFQHAGHKTSVTDFHWNPFDPMTIASVSSGDGGNTL